MVSLSDIEYESMKCDIQNLKNENAELKEKLEEADNVTDCFNKQEEIIAKAKELLREIIDTPVFNQTGGELYENEGYIELVEEVEQFLKENE